MEPKDDVLTIGEVAAYLRVHFTTIYRLLRQGRLPGFRAGGKWRFQRAAIEEWQRSQPFEVLKPIRRGRWRKPEASKPVNKPAQS
jgi:excisionase family DNA binding protein